MAMSEAHIRATRKYQTAHYDSLRLDVRKGDKERIRQAAQAAGVSVSAYIRMAIVAQMERDGIAEDERIATLDAPRGSEDEQG